MRGYIYEVRESRGEGGIPCFLVMKRHGSTPEDTPGTTLARCSQRNYAEGIILAIRKADKLDEVGALLLKCGLG